MPHKQPKLPPVALNLSGHGPIYRAYPLPPVWDIRAFLDALDEKPEPENLNLESKKSVLKFLGCGKSESKIYIKKRGL